MKQILNRAHKNALELLKIAHEICQEKGFKYTLAADTLIGYVNELPFSDDMPIIYIALMYQDFCVLRERLSQFCENNQDYSIHDYSNTEQFNTFELWFVKHAHIQLKLNSKQEAFYYGTRMIIVPLFYAGSTEKEWKKTYTYYRTAIGAINARAVLKGKPLLSYIRLSKKRLISNYLRKKKNQYSIEHILHILKNHQVSEYVVCPFVVSRNSKDCNSLPWVVQKESIHATAEVWTKVKLIDFNGVKSYVAETPKYIIDCFPRHVISNALNRNKSQLALNGYEDLRRVQQIQVELLTEFDRICRKYGLRYNISFGTLLGAARHKGFIPWDDDIDVTMPWEDYNKLDFAVKQEIDNEKYYFRTPESEENNHLIFKHFERKGTLYTKPGRTKLKQQIGVFIDIFPMYPAAPNAFFDWFHAKICRYWRTALWATVGADSEPSVVKRFFYRQMAKPGNKRCYNKFVRAATFFSNNRDNLKFWIAMDRNPYKTALVRMSNYNDTVELEFEGKTFMAPRNYEEVLDYCFGADWRMYPSTRGRVTMHNAIIELGDLYKNEGEVKL